MDLVETIDQFLRERIDIGRMDAQQAGRYQFRLVGDSSISTSPIGFVSFLNAIGVSNPRLEHLDSHYVGRYWEYLMQHHGGLQASYCLRALRSFWRWCAANEYIKHDKMPPDLVRIAPENFYRIRTTIEERARRRSRS